MKLGLRELRRRPKTFAVPTITLWLLALLLLYPSTILDGLYDASTGEFRQIDGELVVFSSDAHRSLFRSRIDEDTQARVARVPGVERAEGFSAIVLTARLPAGGADAEPFGISVVNPGAIDVGPGEALADSSLQAAGVEVGSTVLVGPFRTPVTVVGTVDDHRLLLQGSLLTDDATWHEVIGQSDPEAALGPGVSQALVVHLADGVDADEVAAGIDAVTGGATDTLDVAAAIRALPGIEQQDATFGALRVATLAVAAVVVGLFLSFLTLERRPLFAAMKAIGASSRHLLVGVATQTSAMTLLAVAVAVAVTLVLGWVVPLDLPTTLRPSRVVETAVGLLATALVGSVLALRKIVSIDPASAIG